jgi:hypothetical protein
MDEKDISLFETVISNLTTYSIKEIERFKDRNKYTIEKFETNYKIQKRDFQSISTDLSRKFLEIQKDSEQKNKLSSCDLNVFRMFGVGETMHSEILANLLNPYGEHGQKHLFLNEFLDLLSIKRTSDTDNWIVTAEKGRIDILLKRVDPHSVIVIENKSNYAIDQENQLYRYWYQEIYIKTKEVDSSFYEKNRNRYRIIYMTPNLFKYPDIQSKQKPKDEGWTKIIGLPDKMPIECEIKSFNGFVNEWLKKCLGIIPKPNHRMIEFVKQYLELWT